MARGYVQLRNEFINLASGAFVALARQLARIPFCSAISGRSLRPVITVFVPFAAGYYLSYLFRTINALISDQLTADLKLGAVDLGLLTSVYFLTFAAAQLPIGTNKVAGISVLEEIRRLQASMFAFPTASLKHVA